MYSSFICTNCTIGVNTGFGGSADTRTKSVRKIQYGLIRELHSCIVTSSTPRASNLIASEDTCKKELKAVFDRALPLEDHLTSNQMPEAWSRAILLIRLNSLMGGQSAVRPSILVTFATLLNRNITPVIPLCGTLSASGDLAPLAYVVGALLGKRNAYVWAGSDEGRRIVRADVALEEAGLVPITLEKKEGLAIVNGTGASCGVSALAVNDANHLAVMAQILTAMSVEALNGTDESFEAYIAQVRPHPGQVRFTDDKNSLHNSTGLLWQIDSSHNIFRFLRGSKLLHQETDVSAFGKMRQDRYSIRSASQWLGPLLEDMVLSYNQVLTECNSITDNPIMHPSGRVFISANFQAKSISSAIEKMRQNLESIGRILFAQCTEIVNPATNKGLPPNLVTCEPSESWLFKMVDINLAALQGELGFLAHPVNHVHTTETGNQSIHSLALVSARYTHIALGILLQVVASHLLMVCQALDLRAMQANFLKELEPLFLQLVGEYFLHLLISVGDDNQAPGNGQLVNELHKEIWGAIPDFLNSTTNMDTSTRFLSVAASTQPLILDHIGTKHEGSASSVVRSLSSWKTLCAGLMKDQFLKCRNYYTVNADATPYLGLASKKMYRFVRQDLKVPFHRPC
jgi:phenylalanine ammonia-lyase